MSPSSDIAGRGAGTRRRRLWRSLLGAVVLSVLCAGLAWAGPGSPDRSFNGTGKVITDFGDPNGAQGFAMAIGPKGRIVVVGSIGGGQSVALARYLPNGRLDPSFADGGTLVPDLGTASGTANAVAIDHRGRIVIAGAARRTSGGDAGFMIARFHPNGTPDRSFSGDGLQLTQIGHLAEVRAIAIDAHNRIIAAGYSAATRGYGNLKLTVARYLPSGRLDASFGHNGIFRGRFGKLPGGAAAGVALDRHGRIVLGGTAVERKVGAYGHYTRFAVVRLTSDGHLDRSFGQDGEARTAFGKNSATISAIAIDPRGRIVAAGDSSDAAVARYLPNGRLDRSFSSDGKVVDRISLAIDSLAIDHEGRIVLGGNVGGSLPIAWAIARLRPNGAPDTSFGYPRRRNGNAIQTPQFSSAMALCIDRQDRIVGAGATQGHYGGDSHTISFALERYRSN